MTLESLAVTTVAFCCTLSPFLSGVVAPSRTIETTPVTFAATIWPGSIAAAAAGDAGAAGVCARDAPAAANTKRAIQNESR